MDPNKKVLSIIRSFIRHAVSSILYDTICYDAKCKDGVTSFLDKDFCGMELKFIDVLGMNSNDGSVRRANG